MKHNEMPKDTVDIAVANLIFSGLSIAQMDKIPKWLLENIEKNKPMIEELRTTAYNKGVEVGRVESLKLARDARDEHNVARHGDSFYDAYDRVIDALTDAQKVLTDI